MIKKSAKCVYTLPNALDKIRKVVSFELGLLNPITTSSLRSGDL
jgi:hypothetical protein